MPSHPGKQPGLIPFLHLFLEIADHIFCRHIPGEFILCHRATTITFKAASNLLHPLLYAASTFSRQLCVGMQVRTEFDIRIGWNEIGK
jgi:hypothetical protein